MRHQTAIFMRKFFAEKGSNFNKALEVGSKRFNGDIKECFPIPYTGIDMQPGDNVDIVLNGHDLVKHFGRNKFDVVCSFDTFEHDDMFWRTVDQMKKVLRSGGYLVLGVPGRFAPLHEYPSDYWRWMKPGFETFFEGMEDVYVEAQADAEGREPEDAFYGWGRKV